jgi:hypothetical protein
MWVIAVKNHNGDHLGWVPKSPYLRTEMKDGGYTPFKKRRKEYETQAAAIQKAGNLRLLHLEHDHILEVEHTEGQSNKLWVIEIHTSDNKHQGWIPKHPYTTSEMKEGFKTIDKERRDSYEKKEEAHKRKDGLRYSFIERGLYLRLRRVSNKAT